MNSTTRHPSYFEINFHACVTDKAEVCADDNKTNRGCCYLYNPTGELFCIYDVWPGAHGNTLFCVSGS